MTRQKFLDNKAEITTRLFHDFMDYYHDSKTSSKAARQSHIILAVHTLGEMDIPSLHPADKRRCIENAVQMSTWAKRGSVRQDIIGQIENLFHQTADDPALKNYKKDVAEMLVKANKPARVAFFADYLANIDRKTFTPDYPSP